jgi:hypothetical protein
MRVGVEPPTQGRDGSVREHQAASRFVLPLTGGHLQRAFHAAHAARENAAAVVAEGSGSIGPVDRPVVSRSLAASAGASGPIGSIHGNRQTIPETRRKRACKSDSPLRKKTMRAEAYSCHLSPGPQRAPPCAGVTRTRRGISLLRVRHDSIFARPAPLRDPGWDHCAGDDIRRRLPTHRRRLAGRSANPSWSPTAPSVRRGTARHGPP